MIHLKQLSKRQKSSVIASCIITCVVVTIFVTSIIESSFLRNVIVEILSAAIIVLLGWGFRRPSKKTSSKIFNYYLTSFPMLLALILIYLVYELQQIPELQTRMDPLFSVGLWFVVLSSISSLVVIINTDQRIDELEKKLFGEKNLTSSNSKPIENKNIPLPESKLKVASQIASIVSAGALVVAGVTLYFNYNEEATIEKEFKINNVPVKVPSLVVEDVPIQNFTYRGYQLIEKVSISTVSTHLLRVHIQNITFANIPYGNFTIPSEIVVRPIDKYLDAGASNLDFDVPFYLTFDELHLAPYPKDTVMANIPLITHIQVSDLQNDSGIPQNLTASSYLSIKDEYLPKQ